MPPRVYVDLRRAFSKLENFEKSVRFVGIGALNDTAFAVRGAEQGEIDRRLSARPWIRRGVLVRMATPARHVAEVYVAERQLKFLRENLAGGTRAFKAFEGRLRAANVLATSQYAVPGPSLPLDSYGSPRKAALLAILRAVALIGPRQRFKPMNRRSRRPNAAGIFVLNEPHGKLGPGIYERTATGVKSYVLFTGMAPRYRARIDFEGVARDAISRAWPRAVRRRMNQLGDRFKR